MRWSCLTLCFYFHLADTPCLTSDDLIPILVSISCSNSFSSSVFCLHVCFALVVHAYACVTCVCVCACVCVCVCACVSVHVSVCVCVCLSVCVVVFALSAHTVSILGVLASVQILGTLA